MLSNGRADSPTDGHSLPRTLTQSYGKEIVGEEDEVIIAV